MSKSLFQSKTFWIAVAQGVIGILIVVQQAYPNLGALIIAKSLLDVILRLLSDKPVTL